MVRGRRELSETHVLVFPFPAQGHINPMLQFSKRLASKGLKVTFITTTPINNSSSVQIAHIPVGFQGEAESIDDYFERFNLIVSEKLGEMVERCGVRALVYDSVMPWAQDVVERLGVEGAPFFTQSCAVSTIYYHVSQAVIKIPVQGPTVSLPSMPLFSVHDLPSFVNDNSSYPKLSTRILNQLEHFEKVSWVFFNTFSKLEDEVVKWLESKGGVKTIGPTIPSMYLDGRLGEEDKDYGMDLLMNNSDACITWLDTKDTDSVVYVSFGSLAILGEEQMQELAWGLKSSNTHFLWVVRESERKKLPPIHFGEGDVDDDDDTMKGLVVSWCPQLEVLAHRAVGCFMTHCGWNSVLEGVSLGVPMVALPQWTDQPTNAKFVEDVWGVGVRAKVGEGGIVRREEIERRLMEVMEGERGKEMRRNAQRWRELAKEAVDQGGTSDNNIQDFVAHLACS